MYWHYWPKTSIRSENAWLRQIDKTTNSPVGWACIMTPNTMKCWTLFPQLDTMRWNQPLQKTKHTHTDTVQMQRKKKMDWDAMQKCHINIQNKSNIAQIKETRKTKRGLTGIWCKGTSTWPRKSSRVWKRKHTHKVHDDTLTVALERLYTSWF